MASEITTVGTAVHSIATDMPVMIVVAGPVCAASAISRTGRYRYSV